MLRSSVWFFKALMVGLVLCAWPPSPAGAQAQGDLKLQPGIGWGGVGFYSPQHWGVVRSSILNGGAAEAGGLLAITTAGSGNVQFAKELWVPAKSRLDTFTPIRLERLPSGESRGLEAQAAIYSAAGREVALASEAGMLNVRDGGFQTAIMGGAEGDRLIAMAASLRESAGLPPTTAYLNPKAAPTFAPVWDVIGLFVLGEPSPDFDAAQAEALRRFLVGGGRLWVDLTRVDPDFMSRLLRDDWNVSVIDRVGRTEFTIEGPGGPHPINVDYPIDHVRVVAPDMETLHSVGGYPATLRKAVGRGTLFVSTLEPDAFMDAEKKANGPLRSLSWLLRSTGEAGETNERMAVLQAVASDQIGYSIIGRVPVAIVLGVFTLALLAIGLWLSRRGDLAKLGWIAPVVAVVAAVALLGLGLARQSEVPFTLASAEIVEVTPDAPYAQATTLVSVYTPWGAARDDAALRGEGEPAWPDLQTHGGQNVRVVWTGENRWRYDNLTLREGMVQTAQRQTIAPLADPIAAPVTLTAEGLRGRVETGGLGSMQDAVILTPSGKLTVVLGEDGAFAAPAVDPLGPNQYFEGAVLAQRQMARQEVYRQLVADRRFVERPVLAGWVEGSTSTVAVSDEAERRERSLLVVPLVIAPPAGGTPIAVPAPLLRMRPFRGDKDLLSAPIYDERTRDWVPTISNAQTVMMAYDLPESVRGLKVDAARMTIDFTAMGRPYEVLVYDNGRARTVREGESPAGLQTIELTGADAPQPLPDGSVVVGLRVGEPTDPMSMEPWSLTRMDLGVSGTAR